MIDWLALGKWIPGAIQGVRKLLGRPRLKLSVGADDPWSVATDTTRPPDANPIEWAVDGVMNYYWVQVKNSGRSTALGCHMRLDELWYVERGLWKKQTAWEPVDLIWAGRPDQRTLDLSPRQTEYCDVGHVPSNHIQSNRIPHTHNRRLYRDGANPHGHGRFFLDVARHYIERPNALEEGHYVLRLSAFSQNAPTQTLILDLWVSGRFAEAGDRFMPRPLASIVLKPRRRVPEENTVYDEVAPSS